MSGLAIDAAADGRIIDLRREPDAAQRLPRGKADGRYRCCACGGEMIFSGPARPGSDFTPRFRHDASTPGSDQCTASGPHQADVQADLTVTVDFRDRLMAAMPGASICLQIDPALAGQRWDLPPCLVVRRGAEMVVIERPRRLLTVPVIEQRQQIVRARYGHEARHWWFFDRNDALHFDGARPVNVRPNGQPASHPRVRPTSAQRHINATGGAVCWTTENTALIPFGGHPFTYAVRAGEDWSGKMSSWKRDWRISHPRPADDADWWGLVPVPLLSFGRNFGFRPAPAFQVMAAIEKTQSGREAHRRNLARMHAQQTRAAHQPLQSGHRPPGHGNTDSEGSQPMAGLPATDPPPLPPAATDSNTAVAPTLSSPLAPPPPAQGPEQPRPTSRDTTPLRQDWTWRSILPRRRR